MRPSEAKVCRFIRLGRGGLWAEKALPAGEIPFGANDVPESLVRGADWDGIAAHYQARGTDPKSAADYVREFRAFFEAGPEDLWITFDRGRLWWAFAAPGFRHGGDGVTTPRWIRPTVDGWHNIDETGAPLLIDELHTGLYATRSYPKTMCNVTEDAYLRRRLRGELSPVRAKALSLAPQIRDVAAAAIRDLHWADLEALVDIMLARSGYNRISALGGSQRDYDLVVEHVGTGEVLRVQVKTAGTNAMLQRVSQGNCRVSAPTPAASSSATLRARRSPCRTAPLSRSGVSTSSPISPSARACSTGW